MFVISRTSLNRGSLNRGSTVSGLLVITEEQMENMTAFPALITLYSGKVLPSFENLPVSETSRYGPGGGGGTTIIFG